MKTKMKAGSHKTSVFKKKGCRRKLKGMAAVEFAIVLPVLLTAVFGIVQFGIVLYDKAVITNASREGARAGIVLKSPKPTATDIQTVVTNYTSTYLLTFGKQNTPVVTTTGAGGTFGQPLSVSVSYQYAGLGKMIPAMTGSVTLSATTVMNNE